jgi:hypothetical protein
MFYEKGSDTRQKRRRPGAADSAQQPASAAIRFRGLYGLFQKNVKFAFCSILPVVSV